MKFRKVLGVATGSALLLTVYGANAATFTIVGGTTGFSLQNNFDPPGWGSPFLVGPGTGVTVFTNGNAAGNGLFVTSPVSLTYTYLGSEAAYQNLFEAALSFSAGPLFDNKSGSNPPLTQTFTLGSNPGLVPLLFRSVTPGGLNAINGTSINTGVNLAFVVVNGGATAFAFFEDIAVNGDKDFDDMVVRIDARDLFGNDPRPTPLPAALPLFATGLGAMRLLGWRRRRKKALAAA